MNDTVKRQLIITSDDCGLSEGINNTALNLHEAGIVTTATLMMNFPATEHAVKMIQQHPSLRSGVHLNLTDGYPLTEIAPNAGLIHNDGRFMPRTMLFTRGVFPGPSWTEAVRSEMTAQIEHYIGMMGHKPDHLTTHMHFHMLPTLRDLVLELAEQYGVQWVRAFETRSSIIPFNFLVQAPSELFHPDNRRITPDYITSLQAWLGQEPSELVNTLMGLEGLIEIVVHPDIPDDPTYPDDMNHSPDARSQERDYLLRFIEALGSYRDAFLIADPANGYYTPLRDIV